MTDNKLSLSAKIKYCESSLKYLSYADQENILYQIFNLYSQDRPDDNSENYETELSVYNQKLDRIFSENAVGTILDLDKLNNDGIDLLFSFIKNRLNE